MKLAIVLARLAVSMIATTAIGIISMVYGWGIAPQNWGVILLSSAAVYIIPLVLMGLHNDN